jgi:bacterioferritin (cytochrome b1)
MKREVIIRELNRLLEAELMALEYYRIHADAITDEQVAAGVRAIIPAEHAHAVTLTTRIIELGGDPTRPGGQASMKGKQMGESSLSQGMQAMLGLQLEQEQCAIKEYAQLVADVDEDMITLDLLEEHLFDEMRHAKWLKQTILRLRSD